MNNKKTKVKMQTLLIIILILALIVTIFVIIKKQNFNKGKSLNNEIQNFNSVPENEAEEEFVQMVEDTKLNVNSKIDQERSLSGLKFTNFQLTSKGNQTTLLADVENVSNKDIKDFTYLNISFYNKNEEEIVSIKGFIRPLKKGETTQLNAGLTQDIANAYDLKLSLSEQK